MIQRHNELHDFTATLLTEVCHNVSHSNYCKEKFSIIELLTLTLKRGLILKLEDSGTETRMHTLTLGFSTQMLQAIAPRI